jgi:hypothetical protein
MNAAITQACSIGCESRCRRASTRSRLACVAKGELQPLQLARSATFNSWKRRVSLATLFGKAGACGYMKLADFREVTPARAGIAL